MRVFPAALERLTEQFAKLPASATPLGLTLAPD